MGRSFRIVFTATQMGKPTLMPKRAPPRRLNTKVPGIHQV